MNNQYKILGVADIIANKKFFEIFEIITVDGQEEHRRRPDLAFKTMEEAEEWVKHNS